jgi:hypothetical protein
MKSKGVEKPPKNMLRRIGGMAGAEGKAPEQLLAAYSEAQRSAGACF